METNPYDPRNQDTRQQVAKFLRRKRPPRNADIARALGISPQRVGQLRRELESHEEDAASERQHEMRNR